MEKLDIKDTQTLNIVDENIRQLKEIFPEVIREDKVDFDRLQELLGNYVNDSEENYNFTWHGKRRAARLAQTPSTGTLRPCKEESVDFDKTQNLFIEGDNLEVLKLLQKSYHRKVKMIYIDPPYNTGNEFVYEDDFKDGVKHYLAVTNQIDSEGKKFGTNSNSAGRYHTNWLNMMYPRLKLARNLLRDDGVIFISIDQHELHNLTTMMNDVFGEGCYKNTIIFKRGIKNVQAQFETIDSLTVGHEYVLFYSKSVSTRFKQFKIQLDESKSGAWNNHWRGTDRPTMRYELFKITPESGQWRWGRERSEAAIKNYELMLNDLGKSNADVTQEEIDNWWGQKIEKGEETDLLRLSKSGKPEHYIPPSESKMGSDLWVDLSSRGSSDISSLFNGKSLFDNPKPLGLLHRIIDFSTEDNQQNIVLDFFAGSGSTAHAILDYNAERSANSRFILVQIPEPTSEKSNAYKEGYLKISDLSKERIRRAAKKIKEENPDYKGDLGFKVLKLDTSNIKTWEAGFDSLKEDLFNAVDYIKQDRSKEDILYELLLKYGLDLTAPIETKNIVGKTVYSVGLGALIVCLESDISVDVVNGIVELKEQLKPEVTRVVFKDSGFTDDVVKTNALQILKRAGIEDVKSL